ncbi:MAG: endonuclease/exonuclease/phosphatase family protein [Actinomycetota bacterium]|nr:endonuclease/exonuclease/phosphatase family protein [Actinomycetota bacterium]
MTTEVGGPELNGDGDSEAVAIQADGKIVVAGEASDDFAVARYNPDGSLDTTFGGDGLVTTDYSGAGDAGNAVAIQADGRIVVAGSASRGGDNWDFAVARYNPDGSLDTTFGGDGLVTTDYSGAGDTGNAVAIQADGRIVVAGSANRGGANWDFAVARYNPDGSLDISLGFYGLVTTDFGVTEFGEAVAIQADGRIVVAGSAIRTNGYRDFAVARYHPDGSLDTTLGSDGMVTTDFGANSDGGQAVAIQADGKIVVAGSASSNTGSFDFAVARYHPDGSLDTSFGGDGLVTTVGVGFGQAVAIQADGRIVVAGGSGDFHVARYNPDGSLDTTFGSDGLVTTDFGGHELGRAVALQADGRIVVAGIANLGTLDPDFALARYVGGIPPPGPIDVMTWNIQGMYLCPSRWPTWPCSGSITEIAREIRRSGADVVGLQEVQEHQAMGIARELGWSAPRWFGEDPSDLDATRGLAILSRHPLSDWNQSLLVPPAHPGEELHGYVKAVVTVSGRRFSVYNTHLSAGGPEVQRTRLAQSVFLLGVINEDRRQAESIGQEFNPVILGDMNSKPENADKREGDPGKSDTNSKRSQRGPVDAFLGAGFLDAWAQTHPGWQERPCSKWMPSQCGFTHVSRGVAKDMYGWPVGFFPVTPDVRFDYVFVGSEPSRIRATSAVVPIDFEHTYKLYVAPNWYPFDLPFSWYQTLSDHLPVVVEVAVD